MYSTRYLCQILMRLNIPGRFSKNPVISNLMKIRPVGLSGQTRHDEANSRFSKFYERA
jgi:hypothetical protein